MFAPGQITRNDHFYTECLQVLQSIELSFLNKKPSKVKKKKKANFSKNLSTVKLINNFSLVNASVHFLLLI